MASRRTVFAISSRALYGKTAMLTVSSNDCSQSNKKKFCIFFFFCVSLILSALWIYSWIVATVRTFVGPGDVGNQRSLQAFVHDRFGCSSHASRLFVQHPSNLYVFLFPKKQNFFLKKLFDLTCISQPRSSAKCTRCFRVAVGVSFLKSSRTARLSSPFALFFPLLRALVLQMVRSCFATTTTKKKNI